MKPLSTASPHAIIMVGIPGSGKSTFAEHFAETFQSPIINVGKIRRDFQLNAPTTAAISGHFLKEYVKTRRTIIIDGGSDTKKQRLELIRTAVKAGYVPLIVWVQTDPKEAHRRAMKAYPSGSGLTTETFKSSVKSFEPPSTKEKPVVISGKHTYVTQLKVVLKQIALTPHPQPSLVSTTEQDTPQNNIPVAAVKEPILSRATPERSHTKHIRVT